VGESTTLREKTMNQTSSYRLLILSVLILGFALTASAQEATIVGSVTDQTGLAIPNVTITILNSDTGHSQVISSNDAGQFVVPDLRIGTYAIKAENKGFKTWSTTGLTLRVGDRTRVDIQMQVGNVTDSITVESGALQVQSESSEISDVVTGHADDRPGHQRTQLRNVGGTDAGGILGGDGLQFPGRGVEQFQHQL